MRSAHFDGNTQQLLISGVLRGQTTFGTHAFTSDCLNAPAHFIATYDTDGNCNWVQGSTSGQLIMGPLLVDPVSEIHAYGHNGFMTATFTGGAPLTVGEGAFVAHYNASGVLLGLEHIMNGGQVYDATMIGTDRLLCGIYYPGDSLWNTPLPPPPAGGGGFLARTTPQGQVEWLATVSSDSSVNISGCVVLSTGKTMVYGTHMAQSILIRTRLLELLGCAAPSWRGSTSKDCWTGSFPQLLPHDEYRESSLGRMRQCI